MYWNYFDEKSSLGQNSKSIPNMVAKSEKGEVIGLERRFLCVSWFARYDKSFGLDPFDQKEREEWVMMLACFFFSNKNPSGWPAYRSHWKLLSSLNPVFLTLTVYHSQLWVRTPNGHNLEQWNLNWFSIYLVWPHWFSATSPSSHAHPSTARTKIYQLRAK